MKPRTLFRFASVRPALRRPDRRHVIVGPYGEEPGTKFQSSLAGDGDSVSWEYKRQKSSEFRASDAYLGRSLRSHRAVWSMIEAIPDWLALARAGQEEEAARQIAEAAKKVPRQEAERLGPQLWDSFIAAAVAPATPSQELADLADALRVSEASLRQARGQGAAPVVAALAACPALPRWMLPEPMPGSPMERGIKPAGICDLLIVEERLVGYEHAEISYIENVMRTETKERTYRKLDRTLDSVTVTTTETEETEKDLQTTERNEVMTESQEALTQEMSLSAGVNISASFGPVVGMDTSLDASYGTSSETSSSVATTMAQDIVSRAVTTVSQSRTETIVQRRLSETEEISRHGFKNDTDKHLNGIYRWLEERWRAQVMNYGKRLMLEFLVPEPAALWRESRNQITGDILHQKPRPLEITENGNSRPLRAEDLLEDNYQVYVGRYHATGVEAPPRTEIHLSKIIELPELKYEKNLPKGDHTVQSRSAMLTIPDGYVAKKAFGAASGHTWDVDWEPHLRAHLGDIILDLHTPDTTGDIWNVSGTLEIAVYSMNYVSAVVDIRVRCDRTAEHFAAWQISVYQRIVEAYQKQEDAYQAEVGAKTNTEEVERDELPAEVKRSIEAAELKRGSLVLLTGKDLTNYNAVTGPNQNTSLPEINVAEASKEGPRVLFYENCFEWAQMTYLFYPYFWGRSRNWYDMLKLTDSDPTFEAFLRAGYARVQVPVRPGFERAALYYLATGEIWKGGDAPVIGDDLYVPIVEEIAESKEASLSNAVPYGKPWEYSIPTTLVLLEDRPAPSNGLGL